MIEGQRERLFKASAVIEMCRHACVSQLESLDPDELAVALRVVYDLVNDAASVLEKFADQKLTVEQPVT